MESRVLYEAAFAFEPAWLLLAAVAVAFPLALFVIMRKLREAGLIGRKGASWVVAAAVVTVLLLGGVFLWYEARLYRATVGAYRRGEYRTVEGCVEDFHPMPETGGDRESFTVDGVAFEYSDYELQFGYHNARSLGGVITGDGQHLKIGYVQLRWQGSVIVYIEELP